MLDEVDRRGLDRAGVKTRELVARQPKRFDLVKGVEGVEPFAKLARSGPWVAAIRRALGVDARLVKTGVVVARGRAA